jgi:hypothetical protein
MREVFMRYAIRKRDGRWAIFAGDREVLSFDDYLEALDTARRAAVVLLQRA